MPEIVLSPQASLNGLVITKHADLKLTNQTIKDLKLTVSFKHNERDNRTASNTYRYFALNNITTSDARNTPYSNRKTAWLSGEYRFYKRQSIALAYDLEKIRCWCNNYVIAGNCIVATSNSENKLGVKYVLKASDDLKLNLGYSYARRKVTEDNDAVTALSGLDGAAGVGPLDVNGQNYPGFSPMVFAGRKQNTLKAGVNWQANEKLELAAEGRFAKDQYDPSLGVQYSKNFGINLDDDMPISGRRQRIRICELAQKRKGYADRRDRWRCRQYGDHLCGASGTDKPLAGVNQLNEDEQYVYLFKKYT